MNLPVDLLERPHTTMSGFPEKEQHERERARQQLPFHDAAIEVLTT